MEIKTLAKAKVLEEKIEEKTRALDVLRSLDISLDVWITSTASGEVSLNDQLPEDIKDGILQAATSAIEIELDRLISQFAAL